MYKSIHGFALWSTNSPLLTQTGGESAFYMTQTGCLSKSWFHLGIVMTAPLTPIQKMLNHYQPLMVPSSYLHFPLRAPAARCACLLVQLAESHPEKTWSPEERDNKHVNSLAPAVWLHQQWWLLSKCWLSSRKGLMNSWLISAYGSLKINSPYTLGKRVSSVQITFYGISPWTGKVRVLASFLIKCHCVRTHVLGLSPQEHVERNQFMQWNGLPVESRATQIKLCQVCKTVNGTVSNDLLNFFPQVKEAHGHTRSRVANLTLPDKTTDTS